MGEAVTALEKRLADLRERLRAARRFDGGRVRGLRKLGGLSQKELAQMLGVSTATVSVWERGAGVPGGGASLRAWSKF